MAWKSLALVAMTMSDTGDLDSCIVGNLTLTTGGPKWLEGIAPSAVRPSPTGGIDIHGHDALKFLAKFSRVLLWHMPHENAIEEIHFLSRGLTSVGFEIRYSVIGQEARPFPAEYLRLVSNQFVLRGTDGNLINVYQGQGPMTAVCDVRRPEYAEGYINLLKWLFERQYKSHRPDFLFADTMEVPLYWGTATNFPVINWADWSFGWDHLLFRAQGRLCPVVGHNAGTNHRYLYNRLEEHMMRLGSVDNVAKRVSDLDRLGSVGIASEHRDMPQDPAYWPALYKKLQSFGVPDHKVYLQCARTDSPWRLWMPPTGCPIEILP